MSSPILLADYEIPNSYELDEINDVDFSSTLRAAKYISDVHNKFKVGDILVCKKIQYNDSGTYFSWLTLKGEKQKYKVVYIKDGFAWVRGMTSKGQFSQYMECVIGEGGEDIYYYYELDPDYADHLVLQQDGEYDPTKKIKEFNKMIDDIKRQNSDANYATKPEFGGLDFNKKMFQDIGQGNNFWMGIGAKRPSEYRLVKAPYKSSNIWKVKIHDLKRNKEETYTIVWFDRTKVSTTTGYSYNKYPRVSGLYKSQPIKVPKENANNLAGL